jgi:hypothetical protein
MLAGQAFTAVVGTQRENCVKMTGNVRAGGGEFGVLATRFHQTVGALGQIGGRILLLTTKPRRLKEGKTNQIEKDKLKSTKRDELRKKTTGHQEDTRGSEDNLGRIYKI